MFLDALLILCNVQPHRRRGAACCLIETVTNSHHGINDICDLICENRPLPAFWRSRVNTAVLVPRHLGTRRKILKAIGLTLVEIYSKVFVVLDKYFSQKMPCERVAKICMSISVFVRVY